MYVKNGEYERSSTSMCIKVLNFNLTLFFFLSVRKVPYSHSSRIFMRFFYVYCTYIFSIFIFNIKILGTHCKNLKYKYSF